MKPRHLAPKKGKQVHFSVRVDEKLFLRVNKVRTQTWTEIVEEAMKFVLNWEKNHAKKTKEEKA